MKKIALINQRYGLEVNGGSEYYTRLLAEHLQKFYDVEVLTTKAVSYEKWENGYTCDTEVIQNIPVRRFTVKTQRKTMRMRLLGRCITRMGMNCMPMCNAWVKAQGPYVPDLIAYLQEHESEYDAFIFVTYLYYPTVVGLPLVASRAIMIPTAHDEPYIRFQSHRRLFSMPRGIVYLTDEEKTLVEGLFHNAHIPSVVAGVGVDCPEHIDANAFRDKYGIKGDYIVYVGRVDQSKGCQDMIQCFEHYYSQYGNLQLVIMGQKFMDIPEHAAIRYLGFVDEADKYNGIAGARVLWLPSRYESLSISVLEAMTLSVPVLVNGNCEVLNGHVDKSGGGRYYSNERECVDQLHTLIHNQQLWNACSERAAQYVKKNYLWDSIMDKIKGLIEDVTK